MRLPLDLAPIVEGLRSISDTIRTIRESVEILPDVAATLGQIQAGVERMGDEVHLMRKGVDTLGVEVRGMRESVEPIVSHLDIVAERIERLEPKLEEVSLAIHPLRRATGKLGRRRAANGETVDAQTADVEVDQTSSTENVSQADGSPSE